MHTSIYLPEIKMLPILHVMPFYIFYSTLFCFAFLKNDAGCYPLLPWFHNSPVDLVSQIKKKKKKLAHLEISGTNSSYYRQETESQNNRICPLLYKVMAESSLELIIFSLIHL